MEQGTHDELMEQKDGLYRHMWEQQAMILENEEDMATARKGSIPAYGPYLSPVPNGK